MKFVVDRSKWRCGFDSSNQAGHGETNLLNGDGFMCCLGHCALQAGAKKKDIKDKLMPNNISFHIPVLNKESKTYPGWYKDTKLSEAAAKINDDSELTLKQRERKLRSLFSKFKHKLVFKGKAVQS